MKPITGDEIFSVATKIAAGGIMPTTASIRAALGRGSETTLHKYLQEWKTLLLKHAGRLSQNTNLSLLDENKLLRSNVEALSENLSIYSQDLLKLEQDNANLTQENNELKAELQDHALMLESLKVQNFSMQEMLSKLSIERAETIEQILADKNKLIESLRDELHQVQIDAIEKVRDYSFKDRDLLITQQIKNQNLEIELNRLKSVISKLPEEGLSEPIADRNSSKNSRAQLLSEVYATKVQGILSIEDDDAANI
jgi:hypothetical protein